VATLNTPVPADEQHLDGHSTDEHSTDAHSTGEHSTPAARPTRGAHRLRTAPSSRVAYSLGIAGVCALAVVNLLPGNPAEAGTQDAASVADALGITASSADAAVAEAPALLEELTASRAERDAEQTEAATVQAQAEEAAAAAKAAEEARLAAEAAAKAAAEAEAAKAAELAAAAPAAANVIAKISNSAGGVKAVAQAAANAVVSYVPGAAGMTIGGTRASAADPGGHPSGLALDYMCSVALGNAIVEYHRAHWDELGVEYIIWQQRMLSSPGGSWKGMEDRGSATANHMDHVHVNYR
jgi:hypothetical protein